MSPAPGSSARAYAGRQAGHAPEAIYRALWAEIGQRVSGSVLDCGAGKGNWLGYLGRSARIRERHALDLVDCGAGSVPGVSFTALDLSFQKLPFGEESLDWVFAVEVIEHLENPRFFFREAVRVLRPGGTLVLTTPNNGSLRARLSLLLRGWFPAFCGRDYRESGHITALLPLDFERLAEEAGLQLRLSYPLSGNLPGSRFKWQSFFPWLRGVLWSDCLMAFATKEP